MTLQDDEKSWNSYIATVKIINPGKQMPQNLDTSLQRIDVNTQREITKTLRQDAPHSDFLKINRNVSRQFLSPNDLSFIDRRSAQRIDRGKSRVEATLDLHGYHIDEAYTVLKNFILKAVECNKRLLLVITGKGRRTEDQAKKTLRESLPQFLNTSVIAEHILYYNHAQIKDGGEGAFYLLLRRRKKSKTEDSIS